MSSVVSQRNVSERSATAEQFAPVLRVHVAIARICNPALGYDLVMCNSCGRFLKERPRRGLASLLVERALTAELDLSAEQRGLRI